MRAIKNKAVSWLLSRILSQYINKIPSSQLELAVISGESSIKNLSIKNDVLISNKIPFDIIKGSVGSININCSLLSMLFSPFCLEISDVFILASANSNVIYEGKDKYIKKLTDLFKIDENKNSNFLTRKITSMLLNMVINVKYKIRNIHIRIEQESAAIGIIIPSIDIFTIDDNGLSTQSYQTSLNIKKKISINDFSIYVDCIHRKVFTENFEDEMKNLISNENHEFILNNRSVEGKFIHNIQTSQSNKIEVNLDHINLGMTFDQYKVFLLLIKSNQKYNIKRYFSLICERPESFPNESTKEENSQTDINYKWWNYATKAAIHKTYKSILNVKSVLIFLKERKKYTVLLKENNAQKHEKYLSASYNLYGKDFIEFLYKYSKLKSILPIRDDVSQKNTEIPLFLSLNLSRAEIKIKKNDFEFELFLKRNLFKISFNPSGESKYLFNVGEIEVLSNNQKYIILENPSLLNEDVFQTNISSDFKEINTNIQIHYPLININNFIILKIFDFFNIKEEESNNHDFFPIKETQSKKRKKGIKEISLNLEINNLQIRSKEKENDILASSYHVNIKYLSEQISISVNDALIKLNDKTMLSPSNIFVTYQLNNSHIAMNGKQIPLSLDYNDVEKIINIFDNFKEIFSLFSAENSNTKLIFDCHFQFFYFDFLHSSNNIFHLEFADLNAETDNQNQFIVHSNKLMLYQNFTKRTEFITAHSFSLSYSTGLVISLNETYIDLLPAPINYIFTLIGLFDELHKENLKLSDSLTTSNPLIRKRKHSKKKKSKHHTTGNFDAKDQDDIFGYEKESYKHSRRRKKRTHSFMERDNSNQIPKISHYLSNESVILPLTSSFQMPGIPAHSPQRRVTFNIKSQDYPQQGHTESSYHEKMPPLSKLNFDKPKLPKPMNEMNLINNIIDIFKITIKFNQIKLNFRNDKFLFGTCTAKQINIPIIIQSKPRVECEIRDFDFQSKVNNFSNFLSFQTLNFGFSNKTIFAYSPIMKLDFHYKFINKFIDYLSSLYQEYSTFDSNSNPTNLSNQSDLEDDSPQKSDSAFKFPNLLFRITIDKLLLRGVTKYIMDPSYFINISFEPLSIDSKIYTNIKIISNLVNVTSHSNEEIFTVKNFDTSLNFSVDQHQYVKKIMINPIIEEIKFNYFFRYERILCDFLSTLLPNIQNYELRRKQNQKIRKFEKTIIYNRDNSPTRSLVPDSPLLPLKSLSLNNSPSNTSKVLPNQLHNDHHSTSSYSIIIKFDCNLIQLITNDIVQSGKNSDNKIQFSFEDFSFTKSKRMIFKSKKFYASTSINNEMVKFIELNNNDENDIYISSSNKSFKIKMSNLIIKSYYDSIAQLLLLWNQTQLFNYQFSNRTNQDSDNSNNQSLKVKIVNSKILFPLKEKNIDNENSPEVSLTFYINEFKFNNKSEKLELSISSLKSFFNDDDQNPWISTNLISYSSINQIENQVLNISSSPIFIDIDPIDLASFLLVFNRLNLTMNKVYIKKCNSNQIKSMKKIYYQYNLFLDEMTLNLSYERKIGNNLNIPFLTLHLPKNTISFDNEITDSIFHFDGLKYINPNTLNSDIIIEPCEINLKMILDDDSTNIQLSIGNVNINFAFEHIRKTIFFLKKIFKKIKKSDGLYLYNKYNNEKKGKSKLTIINQTPNRLDLGIKICENTDDNHVKLTESQGKFKLVRLNCTANLDQILEKDKENASNETINRFNVNPHDKYELDISDLYNIDDFSMYLYNSDNSTNNKDPLQFNKSELFYPNFIAKNMVVTWKRSPQGQKIRFSSLTKLVNKTEFNLNIISKSNSSNKPKVNIVPKNSIFSFPVYSEITQTIGLFILSSESEQSKLTFKIKDIKEKPEIITCKYEESSEIHEVDLIVFAKQDPKTFVLEIIVNYAIFILNQLPYDITIYFKEFKKQKLQISKGCKVGCKYIMVEDEILSAGVQIENFPFLDFSIIHLKSEIISEIPTFIDDNGTKVSIASVVDKNFDEKPLRIIFYAPCVVFNSTNLPIGLSDISTNIPRAFGKNNFLIAGSHDYFSKKKKSKMIIKVYNGNGIRSNNENSTDNLCSCEINTKKIGIDKILSIPIKKTEKNIFLPLHYNISSSQPYSRSTIITIFSHFQIVNNIKEVLVLQPILNNAFVGNRIIINSGEKIPVNISSSEFKFALWAINNSNFKNKGIDFIYDKSYVLINLHQFSHKNFYLPIIDLKSESLVSNSSHEPDLLTIELKTEVIEIDYNISFSYSSLSAPIIVQNQLNRDIYYKQLTTPNTIHTKVFSKSTNIFSYTQPFVENCNQFSFYIGNKTYYIDIGKDYSIQSFSNEFNETIYIKVITLIKNINSINSTTIKKIVIRNKEIKSFQQNNRFFSILFDSINMSLITSSYNELLLLACNKVRFSYQNNHNMQINKIGFEIDSIRIDNTSEKSSWPIVFYAPEHFLNLTIQMPTIENISAKINASDSSNNLAFISSNHSPKTSEESSISNSGESDAISISAIKSLHLNIQPILIAFDTCLIEELIDFYHKTISVNIKRKQKIKAITQSNTRKLINKDLFSIQSVYIHTVTIFLNYLTNPKAKMKNIFINLIPNIKDFQIEIPENEILSYYGPLETLFTKIYDEIIKDFKKLAISVIKKFTLLQVATQDKLEFIEGVKVPKARIREARAMPMKQINIFNKEETRMQSAIRKEKHENEVVELFCQEVERNYTLCISQHFLSVLKANSNEVNIVKIYKIATLSHIDFKKNSLIIVRKNKTKVYNLHSIDEARRAKMYLCSMKNAYTIGE